MANGSGPDDARELYAQWLAGQPLAERSKHEYLRNVALFCAWLAGVEDAGWGGDPLRDPLARDYAARDFKRFLKVERGLRPASVNLALASLDSLYRCLGLGSPNVRRRCGDGSRQVGAMPAGARADRRWSAVRLALPSQPPHAACAARRSPSWGSALRGC